MTLPKFCEYIKLTEFASVQHDCTMYGLESVRRCIIREKGRDIYCRSREPLYDIIPLFLVAHVRVVYRHRRRRFVSLGDFCRLTPNTHPTVCPYTARHHPSPLIFINPSSQASARPDRTDATAHYSRPIALPLYSLPVFL